MNRFYEKKIQHNFYSSEKVLTAVNSFISHVYKQMFLGLSLSGLIAWLISSNLEILSYFVNRETGSFSYLYWTIIFLEFGLVFYLGARIKKIQPKTATILFFLYATLNGIFLSPILLTYTHSSIFKVFLITAGTFGIISTWASRTKKDLSSWGSFLFMGLIGICFTLVINIFLLSPMIDWAVSLLGIGLFIGLTAYDVQKLQKMALEATNEITIKKMSIFGALTLYLDFVNLFLFLLRFLGDRR